MERTLAVDGGWDPAFGGLVCWSPDFKVAYSFEVCDVCGRWFGYALGGDLADSCVAWSVRFRDDCPSDCAGRDEHESALAEV
jgi:hypothetical protein